MATIKFAELTGPMLDYWVAKAEGRIASREYAPSSEYLQGRAIVDRENIEIMRREDGSWYAVAGRPQQHEFEAHGPTALIAAMRVYLVSKFGDELPPE